MCISGVHVLAAFMVATVEIHKLCGWVEAETRKSQAVFLGPVVQN